MVGNKNVMLLQEFIQEIYDTTVSYFKSNLLAINCPKTEIMMVPYGDEEITDVFIMNDDGEIIKSLPQVKILGDRFNSFNYLNAHMLTLSSSEELTFNKLKLYIQHASLRERRLIMQAKLESLALCAASLCFNKSESVTKR